jgi:hypothetical protein
MAYFLCKLVPPRPGFPFDMTEAEAALMRRHADYWRAQVDKGVAIAFGPVLDPKGAWGVALAEAAGESEVGALTRGDPVMGGSHGFSFEIYPMPSLIHRGQPGASAGTT